MAVLDNQLAALATMSPAQLRERWEQDHGHPAPPGFGPDLLQRSIAYRLQEKGAGGLPANILREIRRAAVDMATATIAPNRAPPLRLGTRLTREWHGRTHHVLVVEGGFEHRDQRYRSLTAIARKITGAGWSGPRFFGLTSIRSQRRDA